jgi:hypothetical protein
LGDHRHHFALDLEMQHDGEDGAEIAAARESLATNPDQALRELGEWLGHQWPAVLQCVRDARPLTMVEAGRLDESKRRPV